MTIKPFPPDLNGEALRVGIVQARFNEPITQALLNACVQELLRLHVENDSIVHITVPGALEIPQVLARLGRMQEFDVLIAVGCVVRGETYHFEVVSNESASGVAQVGMNTPSAVINAILTVEDEEQAHARVEEKGREAAQAAVEMGNLMLMLDIFDDDDDDHYGEDVGDLEEDHEDDDEDEGRVS